MKAIIFLSLILILTTTLAQSDQTGKWLTLSPAPSKTSTFSISDNFPPKVMDNLHFNVETKITENIEVFVLDMESNQISKTKLSISPEHSEINIPLYNLPTGKYAVYLQGKKNYCQKYFYVAKS